MPLDTILPIALLMSCLIAGGATSETPTAGYRLSGPYTHDNLTIFLIHGSNRPHKKVLSLQEALTQRKAVVYETGSVNELAVENLSPDEDIYLQSGDIVKGGQQDRVLKDDLIIEPKSGRLPIASFCVEHGRWTRRGSEAVGRFDSARSAVGGHAMKMAVRQASSQTRVWDEVARTQRSLSSSMETNVASPVSPTSLPLTLENSAVKKTTDQYVTALSEIIDGKADVIGYAFAVNGKLSSADLYASGDLFQAQWKKLLQASAVEAVAARNSAGKFEPVKADAVKASLLGAEKAQGVEKVLTRRTTLVTRESPSAMIYETHDRSQNGWLHLSLISK